MFQRKPSIRIVLMKVLLRWMEQFIFGGMPMTIARKIKDDIEREFQLPCAVGIGPNMLMSKLCLDLEAKKAWNR